MNTQDSIVPSLICYNKLLLERIRIHTPYNIHVYCIHVYMYTYIIHTLPIQYIMYVYTYIIQIYTIFQK